MKKSIVFGVLLSAVIIVGCKKEKTPQELILGKWPFLAVNNKITKTTTSKVLFDSTIYVTNPPGQYIKFNSNGMADFYFQLDDPAITDATIPYKLINSQNIVFVFDPLAPDTFSVRTLTSTNFSVIFDRDQVADTLEESTWLFKR